MKGISILAALLLVAACAEPAANTGGATPRAEREYPTGSNIPRRSRDTDGVQVYDREAVQRSQDSSYGGGIPRVPTN
jgi:hypothetical protein